MTEQIARLYREWCRTGELPNDIALIKIMYIQFMEIYHSTRHIDEYALMTAHAFKNAQRLYDILMYRGVSLQEIKELV